ncbi:MAG TPA: hypothetical protein VKY92_16665 [Verrucomicrobiae bacterium]|nr:hypothetical protein [Verrucomicrobiae bacterium]
MLPVRGLYFNTISTLVPLGYSDDFTLDRADSDRFSTFRIGNLRIAGNTLPGVSREYAPSRMRNRQQKLTARVEAHCDQASHKKLFALAHVSITELWFGDTSLSKEAIVAGCSCDKLLNPAPTRVQHTLFG